MVARASPSQAVAWPHIHDAARAAALPFPPPQREYTPTHRADFAAPDPRADVGPSRRKRFGMVAPDTINEAAYA
jgi:hypothetical protein